MSAPGPSRPFLLVSVNGKKEFSPSAEISRLSLRSSPALIRHLQVHFLPNSNRTSTTHRLKNASCLKE